MLKSLSPNENTFSCLAKPGDKSAVLAILRKVAGPKEVVPEPSEDDSSSILTAAESYHIARYVELGYVLFSLIIFVL
jgi:hypothetical protein